MALKHFMNALLQDNAALNVQIIRDDASVDPSRRSYNCHQPLVQARRRSDPSIDRFGAQVCGKSQDAPCLPLRRRSNDEGKQTC